jgi:hypothetical protein
MRKSLKLRLRIARDFQRLRILIRASAELQILLLTLRGVLFLFHIPTRFGPSCLRLADFLSAALDKPRAV